LVAVFIAVTRPSRPPTAVDPSGFERAREAVVKFPTEPVTRPLRDLTPVFELVEPPPHDLSLRTETLWPSAGRPDGARPGRGQGQKKELPLFVQAADRLIEEKQLLKEVQEANVGREPTTLLQPEPITEAGDDTEVRKPEGGIGSGVQKPKGGIEGFKEGMAAAADGIENFFTGGTP
jgi:hypothetical protein